jgi:predicted PurR-regulated permease PerM
MGANSNDLFLILLILAGFVIVALVVTIVIVWRNYSHILKRYYFHVSDTSHFEKSLLDILRNQNTVQEQHNEKTEEIKDAINTINDNLKWIRSELSAVIGKDSRDRGESKSDKENH